MDRALTGGVVRIGAMLSHCEGTRGASAGGLLGFHILGNMATPARRLTEGGCSRLGVCRGVGGGEPGVRSWGEVAVVHEHAPTGALVISPSLTHEPHHPRCVAQVLLRRIEVIESGALTSAVASTGGSGGHRRRRETLRFGCRSPRAPLHLSVGERR
jgi:hypothetical protein